MRSHSPDHKSPSSADTLHHASNNGPDSVSPPTSKRKFSASAHDASNNHEEDVDVSGKKKRRKVNHACVYCRRSHMTCDLQRPCARCVKRDIGHLCHDEPREPANRSKSEIGVAEIAPAPEGNGGMNGSVPSASYAGQGSDLGGSLDGNRGSVAGPGPQIAQPTPVSPTQLQRSTGPTAAANNAGNFLQNLDWNNSGVHNQFQDMHHLDPNSMFNTSEVSNEYNMLNTFLGNSLLDDGLYSGNYEMQAFLQDPLLATSSVNVLAPNLLQQQPAGLHPALQLAQPLPALAPPPSSSQTKAAAAGEAISRPGSAFPVSEQSRNKFYMTAADPAGLSSAEVRLDKLLKAKYDAGMLKPFNYVKGYARLNAYMSRHLPRESQVRILRQLDRFRPKFREKMQSLTDTQLVRVELWFERSLMEYDRVFASMAIPACCWRRTGEIFRGNREMAELINVPWEKLRDGKLAIHEILGEESLVNYWEKFGAIAFDQSQKAILTSCSLKSPDGSAMDEKGEGKGQGLRGTGDREREKKKKKDLLKCCFSFTIRRDTHNM